MKRNEKEIQYEKVVLCKVIYDGKEQKMPPSTETIYVTSTGTMRDTIYSTALTMIEKGGTTLSKTVKFSSSLGIALPFSAIGIMMDSKTEGRVQATITGLLTTGIVVGVSFLVLETLPVSVPITITVGILSGFANYFLGNLIDGIYDYGEDLYWEWKYNKEKDKLILETTEPNISDIRTLIDSIPNDKETKKYLENIEIEQHLDEGTKIYTIKPSDTIWDICNKYDIPKDTLNELNPWLPDRYSPDDKFALIRPNETLILPNNVCEKLDKPIKLLPEQFDKLQELGPTAGDPVLIDLNGDGIKTTSLNEGIYIDHESDGFAEKSAWVSSEDGILFIVCRLGFNPTSKSREHKTKLKIAA
jgi:hypothetical protein